MAGKRIILASGSPRRKELLKGLDLDFTVDTQNSFEEKFDAAVAHCDVPLLMAEGKSAGFHRALEDDEILITADTMVLCDGLILGKPKDRADALRMLRSLSGKVHQVITGVVIRSNARKSAFSDKTDVWFKDFTDEELEYYVDTCKPYDKAGSYAIQEWIGHAGITKIEGSVYNVVGLPVHRVYEELKSFIED